MCFYGEYGVNHMWYQLWMFDILSAEINLSTGDPDEAAVSG